MKKIRILSLLILKKEITFANTPDIKYLKTHNTEHFKMYIHIPNM